MNRIFILLLAGIGLCLFSCENQQNNTSDAPEWIQLFNGNNLEDWKVKIRNHDLGYNYGNTFRVEDGLMKVRYDEYSDFDQQYGHIFYKEPFSYYLLQLEYRFVGEQAPGGEGWAWRNSGAMLHGQAPETMLKDQDFPISIEAQLLGGNGSEERSTCNLCTPGTEVYLADTLFTPHCINSNSKTFHGDQWVTVNFLVLGGEAVHHLVEADTVFSYYKPQIGGGMVNPVDETVKIDGKSLAQGYISLQSESHPIDFRKVALLDLSQVKDQPLEMKKWIDQALNQ